MTAYVVLEVRSMISRAGNKIYELDLVNTQTRMMYRTYADPKLRNFPNWSRIIANPNRGYILTNIKIRDEYKQIVDADAKPRTLSEFDTREELLEELYQYWQELDNQAA